MENRGNVYQNMELILKKMLSSGEYSLQNLSSKDEKAVALLLEYRAVFCASGKNANTIFPGENFREMVEFGPEKCINLAEKLSPAMIPSSWKTLNLNLLISGTMGAAIGGAIAGAISFYMGCG